MEDQIRGQQHHPMHVTEEASSGVTAAASSLASSSNTRGNFKSRLPTVDIQDCSGDQRGLGLASEDGLEDEFAISKTAINSAPTPALTPPQCTPRSTSPLLRSPSRKMSSTSTNSSVAGANSSSSSTTNTASNQKQFLQGWSKF